ncbi:hypothetical protein BDP27DRAFT_1369990 [Rhodocollybia butyracea]|uniref:C2H2-type domain-containing protein n=1 Tax=Rhodocollybia butyracea TaxID=206335 RepID=A0A9P5U078_9AGAR|nr:hypothetical protein BDP27DRAFT_1369990 [Rhodocollybia butyracea]
MSSASKLSYLCNGCGKPFKRTWHLIQHLKLTQKPKCRDAHEALKKTIRHSQFMPRKNPSVSRRTRTAAASQENKLDNDLNKEELQQFQGDFFGQDYSPDDFPGFDKGPAVPVGKPNVDSDEDSDEDGCSSLAPELEQTWEPRREPALIPESDDMAVDESEDLAPPKVNPLLRNLPLHRDDIYVEVFGGRAGAIIDTGTFMPVSYDSEDGYQLYESQIPGICDNKWSPFASRLDWEVAQWAKMRGSSSTAFSELLAIDGGN